MLKTRRRQAKKRADTRAPGRPRVLHVEDSPTQAEATSAALEDGGYDVTLARSGDEAVYVLGERTFDIVISDIVMPGKVDGYELCRRVKAGPHGDTPVVLLTSLSDPMDIIRGLEAGADNFLTKPCAPDHLLDRLQVILATKRSRARGRVRAGIAVYFLGRQFTITSEREQILDLLVSTFEDAVRQNHELREREERLARSQQSLAALYQIAVGLNACNTEAEVAAAAVAHAVEIPGVRAGWLVLREGETGFRIAATRNVPPALQEPGALDGDCLCRQRLLAGDLDQVTNMMECERLTTARGDTRGLRYHASVPLWIGERTVGILNLVGSERGLVSEEDRALLYGVGNQIATALERTRLRQQLETLVEQRTAALRAEITERTRAEETLREREKQLSSIYETAADILFQLAVEPGGTYRFTSVNRAFLSVTGLGLDQIVGKRVDEVIPQPSLALVLARYGEAIREKRVVRWEETSVYPTGELTGEVSIAPVFDAAGRCTHLVGAVHDVTERKRAETALRESEERYRSLVNEVNDGFFVADEHGRFTYANRALALIHGLTNPAELIGRTFLEFVAPSARAAVEAEFRAGVGSGAKPKIVTATIVRPDGGEGVVEVKPVTVYQDERVVGTRGVVRDITERKRLEDQFRQAQKMEAVGRLAGGVAHDFNNILTAIMGTSSLMLDEAAQDSPLRNDILEIQRAAERAAALTRQLLAFSRKQLLQPRVLNLNRVVEGVEGMLRRLVGEDVAITTKLAADLASVRVDPGQMEQVILNLAVNARDAMPQGGTLSISTANVELDEEYAEAHTSVSPGSYVMLAASDTGTGISEQSRAHLFEPFFTTKEMGKGTGLGLATVYGIVKQSGGYIWVYSEPGQGATFKIYLPQVKDSPEELGPTPQEAPRGGSEVVLLAEDDRSVRTLAATILRKQGYTVLEASNGQEAIALAETHQGPIELILTDVVMPQLGGGPMVERLLALRPAARVLYVSGYTDDTVARQGLLQPGVQYLEKPFTPSALLRKVRQVLDMPA